MHKLATRADDNHVTALAQRLLHGEFSELSAREQRVIATMAPRLPPASIVVSVYVDDISLSFDEEITLREAYESTLEVLVADGFAVSVPKLRAPAPTIYLFNCDLSDGRSVVRDERIETFLATAPDPASEEAFVAYCASVEFGNR